MKLVNGVLTFVLMAMVAIGTNVAPPTINLDNPSMETAIDLVAHEKKELNIDIALSNSFGFGGTNASIIMRSLSD